MHEVIQLYGWKNGSAMQRRADLSPEEKSVGDLPPPRSHLRLWVTHW